MNPARANIQQIAGYVPGEQPQETGWIKLNTNENPYPPSPKVVAAIQSAAEGRLNVYPDPLATKFRQAVGELFDVDPDGVLPANGSDENLTIIVRTFTDVGDIIAYPYPSYILYETLADIQGARHVRIPLAADWSFSQPAAKQVAGGAKLVFVPNPNSPSGNRWPLEVIQQLAPATGVLVLDEAYGDFADDPHGAETLRSDVGKRVVITKTLSKSYSLAGIRFGYSISNPALNAEMRKVKDSYNCNTLSLSAGLAAIEDQDWMLANRERILKTRQRLMVELKSLGFDVVPSQANFLWTTHPSGEHDRIYQALKERKILVRYMKFPNAGADETITVDGLRITIGTDAEIDGFLENLAAVVRTL